MLDKVDEDGVEASRLAIGQVLGRAGCVGADHQRPGRLAVDEERRAVGVDEMALVGRDREREAWRAEAVAEGEAEEEVAEAADGAPVDRSR